MEKNKAFYSLEYWNPVRLVKGKIKIKKEKKHLVRNKNYETGQFFDHILIEILEDEMLKNRCVYQNQYHQGHCTDLERLQLVNE